MKNFTALLILSLFSFGFSNAQTARVQVIHNSADAAAATVDVYLNDGSTPLLDNFAFRTASPYIDAPAGTPITLKVAPGTSSSSAEYIFTKTVTLTAGATYIIVANGIVSETGYTPSTAFDLIVYETAREEASVATNTDVLVFHGATDAPMVDVQAVGAGTVVENISYGNFDDGYLVLDTANYILNVATADGATIVASYSAPLETLGLDGQAITVLASGFLNPAVNNNGPAFGLWVALASGGSLVELEAPTARVQVIHNSADAAAASVDVYLNDAPLLDNFAFRTATPFVNAPAGNPITLKIAPAGSTSSEEEIFTKTVTLTEGATYIIVANGIVSEDGYEPIEPFDLFVYPTAREEAAVETNTDVLVFHGATDAPTVDVQVVGAGTTVQDIEYSDFSGYLALATADDYTLNVRSADGATVVASYSAPLETLELDGQAITVLASGFLNPTDNSEGPEFGLWVALAAGGELLPLPTATLNTNAFTAAKLVLYPNPASDIINIAGNNIDADVNHTVFDAAGREVLNVRGNAVDVSSLSNGIYMMQTVNYGQTSENKLVIKK